MESAALPAPDQPTEELVPRRRRRAGVLHDFLTEAGELVVFSVQVLLALPGTFRYFSEILRQAALVVRRASVLLVVMNAFLGFSLATFGFFLLRTISGTDLVGVVTGYFTMRQTSVTMFGYVIAGSVCCAIAAELGSAKIQQEIEAYESTAVDPLQLVVGSRVLAVLLFVPLATVLSMLGHLLGSWLDVVVLLDGNTTPQYLSMFFTVFFLEGFLNAAIMVAAIALPCVIVACFYGLRTSGGPAAVGSSVARALMVNLVLVHVISASFGVLFYGQDLRIPFGE